MTGNDQLQLTMPQRIQRQRTRGWRMPEGAVYVGRPTKWGNPFIVHTPEIVLRPELALDWYCPGNGARRQAVEMFRDALLAGDLPRITAADVRRELDGRDLACWCPLDQPCHAGVLLEVANR